jgi:hypothetical protein
VCYRDEHAAVGFPWYLVGQRLFPTQLLDGAVSLSAVGVALLTVRAPGTLTAVYLVGYGAVRFVVEWLRGDPLRPRLLGMTEAQWTAVLVAVAVAAFTRALLLIAIALVLAAGALAVLLLHRRLRRLTDPWHLEELHRLIRRMDDAADGKVRRTSQALCVSLRSVAEMRDYVFSYADGSLEARAAASLVRHLRFSRSPEERVAVELRPGATPGVIHVLVRR